LTDHEQLPALRRGDETAFDAIFRAYYARLVRMSEGMLGERAPAEEIAQDVMLELWRRRETLVVETSLQLSRWEQEPGPPNPAAGRLIGETMAALAAPV
jgi:DNA-directed RNA polymerase specialized sigma24 family protein